MDFTIGSTPEEMKELAKSADFVGGRYIDEFGAYEGIITSACIQLSKKSKAQALDIEIELEDGKKCKDSFWFLSGKGVPFYISKKDQSQVPLPAMATIQGSLLPCLKMRELPSVKNGDDVTYPSLVGRKIGFLCNIELTTYNNKEYSKAKIDRFFEVGTNLTGSEIVNKIKPEDAKIKETAEKQLRIIDKREKNVEGGSNSADPFGDSASTGEATADPFATDSAADATPDLPAQADSAVVEDKSTPAETAAPETPAVQESAPVTQETESTPAASGGDDFWN